MNQAPSTKQATVEQKTVLFCHGCEYHAPPTGRWIVHEKTDCDVYECPRCGETLTIRDRMER
ncbi:hypothetical protein DM826_06985 [Halonotius aquaticus]|jgi:predicted RNA-binding Zn-ribbon protein involved in translation (DUF1610 family)|uniref:DUF8106 domain-containing protein n=2 Tax=Halonotius TaxID=869896 RepID=A0A3A6Q2C5_9EURY|nr:hypothetical protein [Halonotius aquaticus]RJX43345.1 hypothetical protein DM826_06985 [Halonotius aquaticus]